MQKFGKIKHFKGFNWYGFYTLYLKEVKRFFNVFAQTILAPAITTLLFYMIFTISIDREYLSTENYSFSEFLVGRFPFSVGTRPNVAHDIPRLKFSCAYRGQQKFFCE